MRYIFFCYLCTHKECNVMNKIVCLLLFVAALASCTQSEKSYKIGVSQCSSGRWREKVNSEMLAAQHLYEHDVKVSIAEAHDDTETQLRHIDSLANAGIDLLVVAPNEAAPIAEAIARVKQKGIPVVFFDRKADTEDYAAFIGGNNREAGQTVGHYAVSLAKDMLAQRGAQKPLILEITGSMATSPAQERHEGFAKAMQEQSEADYRFIESSWSSEDAYRVMKKQLKSGRLPDVVFCHNDAMTSGVYKALKEAKQESKVKILGVDGMHDEGIEYVLNGSLTGTYIYPTHGEEIVRLALNILTGQPYHRDNPLKGAIVTPENAKMMWLNSRELVQQNANLITIQDKLEAYFGLYSTQRKVLIASFAAIVLLIVAVLMIWRAFMQTRKVVRQRQTLNEEETLFFTNADSRKLRQPFVTPTEELPQPRSQDTIFVEKLNAAIRENLSNTNLKMEELGEKVGLSRVQLYRKVKAITGLSPVELLRQMRLQQGYVLLLTTNKTVSEIAFEVGFNTPGYFSKCFKEQYGKMPTDLRLQADMQNDSTNET